MKFERKPMVKWYAVTQLASTALKSLISSIFGNFADKREMQAFAPQEVFDYSGKEEIWIDYIADLGDGFNATYTMASLMAREQLTAGEYEMPRGNLLIMGGDEVYPTPEIEKYRNRLQGPYNAAFPWKNDDSARPNLFAIPGNHDWYDGLTNFLRLFCQGRALGNWLTQQRRSYFAIRLPHGYWLLCTDVQLHSDIDEPQKDYFRKIAREQIAADDKIILCTAEPTWVYASLSDDKKYKDAHDRLWFFINKILCGEDHDYYAGKNKDLHISAVVSGDFHHYSRYESTDGRVQFITSGGGGAFLHPTHLLKEEAKLDNESRAKLKSVFPGSTTSKKLAWRNLLFPFYNPGMSLFFGFICLLNTWFLANASAQPFLNDIASIGNLHEFLTYIFTTMLHGPAAVILNVIFFGGILMFTDTATGLKKWNYTVGVLHVLLQAACLYGSLWLLAGWNFGQPEGLWKIIIFSLELLLASGFSAGMAFGIFLLLSTLMLGSHPTEAFSSFRCPDYKNFLRLHIDKNGLTIYPVGVKKVVKDWKNTGTENTPVFHGSPINYSLIEQPIKLK